MRSDYIKPSVYNKIYGYMQYENALALRLSLETGLRIGDCLKCRSEDLKGRTLSFVSQKTGKKGKKVISADLAKRLKAISGNGYLFVGRFGDKPRTRQTVWRDVKKAQKHFKIKENLSCHSARKTYAVEDRKENGLAQVQKDLQHDRMDTTMLYAFSDMLTSKNQDIYNTENINVFANMVADIVYKKIERLFDKNTIKK